MPLIHSEIPNRISVPIPPPIATNQYLRMRLLRYLMRDLPLAQSLRVFSGVLIPSAAQQEETRAPLFFRRSVGRTVVRGLVRKFLRCLIHCSLEGTNFSVDLQQMPTGAIAHSISASR